MERAAASLKKNHLRKTKIREHILAILLQHTERAFSAEELHTACLCRLNADLSTIYRTMNTLTESGLVIKSIHHDGKAYFQIAAHKDEDHHHKIICTQCKAVADVEICPLLDIEEKILSETGFIITAHSIELSGLCPACKSEREHCRFRTAVMNDLDAVLYIVQQVTVAMQMSGNPQWDTGYPNRAVFIQDIQMQNLYIAEINDTVIGMGVLNNDDEAYKEAAWTSPAPYKVLHRFAITPEWQGKHIAQKLLAYIEDCARKEHIQSIRSDTFSANTAMRHFFEKSGYIQGSSIYMRDFAQPFYCFEKKL